MTNKRVRGVYQQQPDKSCLHCGRVFVRADHGSSEFRRKRFCSLRCGNDARVKSPADRFWAKVDKSAGEAGCWSFTGTRNQKGYGMFYPAIDGLRRGEPAHRFSFWIAHGWMPPAGMVVMHTCDNPACVNPAHLRVGTPADNTRDMMEKGRNRPLVGENSAVAKLTERDVRRIRRVVSKRADSATRNRMAAELGVHPRTIYDIAKRKTWTHI